jgi:hypothetical protein
MATTFQHRHYAAIADVLADIRENEGLISINYLEDRLIKLFKADNPKFSADRFRKAATRAPNMHGKDRL